MASSSDTTLREALVATVHKLEALGLNRGSTGNASVRGVERTGGFWITPTGMPTEEITDEKLVWLSDDGRFDGAWAPSSEWPFHRAIFKARADLSAVVHVHSVYATALACLRRELPAFHYMVAVAGGNHVPCTGYHLFGTEALSEAIARAFADRHACLLANHGLVAAGTSLAHALKVAVEIESLCQSYLAALAAGEPEILSDEEMKEVLARFARYGTAHASSPA